MCIRDSHYTVWNITRGEQASEVVLEWDSSPLGIRTDGVEKVKVFPLGEFEVVNATTKTGADPHILIQFSDPILKTQELNGLIRLSNYDGPLKYVVDGNQLKVYSNRGISGQQTVIVQAGIKNINNASMKKNSSWNIYISATEPAVRLVGKGSIIPSSEELLFPFEAIGLRAVDVEVFKICLLYTSPSPRDATLSRMPSSA